MMSLNTKLRPYFPSTWEVCTSYSSMPSLLLFAAKIDSKVLACLPRISWDSRLYYTKYRWRKPFRIMVRHPSRDSFSTSKITDSVYIAFSNRFTVLAVHLLRNSRRGALYLPQGKMV